jgi:protein-disulfide isomerase
MTRRHLVIGLAALAVIVLGAAAYFMFGSRSDDTIAQSPAPDRIQVRLTAADRRMGSPKAPILMVEYAAPSCPWCARFDMTLFPQLKKNYIDTGKVYYVLRVYPRGSADIGAEAIARCLPAADYFQFIDLLWRNQAKWDPENGVQDVRGGLLQMAGQAGLTAARADACMADTAEAERASQVGQDAQTKYNIDSVPTFIIDGQMHQNFSDWQSLQRLLDSMLANR